MPMLTLMTNSKLKRRLTHSAVGLGLFMLSACGGGGGSVVTVNPVIDSTQSQVTSANTAAILGQVLDPFTLCLQNGALSGASICQNLSGLAFPSGSTADLFQVNTRGQLIQPSLGTGVVDDASEFQIPFDGSLFQPPGGIVQVSNGFEQLHGFVFTAAVDVSVWSEAIYRILLREGNSFANYTGAEIRDLENILRVKVGFPSQALSVNDLIEQIIQTGDPIIRELVQVCYSPGGNQADQPCRLELPLPSPAELEELDIVNLGFLVIGGSVNTVVKTNSVLLRIER